jgi:hypothetical protein
VFRLYGSDDIRHVIIVPVTLLLDLLFALALAACSNADSVDRSVAASDSDQKLRTEAAVAGAGETTVGIAAAAGETGDPSGVPFRTRPASLWTSSRPDPP